jgi:hypothetical protein
MAGIERDNPALKGVLPKDYARPALDKTRLGQLIDLISNIKVGDEERAYWSRASGDAFTKPRKRLHLIEVAQKNNFSQGVSDEYQVFDHLDEPVPARMQRPGGAGTSGSSSSSGARRRCSSMY